MPFNLGLPLPLGIPHPDGPPGHAHRLHRPAAVLRLRDQFLMLRPGKPNAALLALFLAG